MVQRAKPYGRNFGLKLNWVADANVLYIGKAGGPNSKSTLRKRIGQYLRFGQGKKIGHWGGRYIWQLSNSDELRIAYKTLPGEDPAITEKAMITEFQRLYGKKPYANLR